MTGIVTFVLDLTLIGLLMAGIYYAVRLLNQLQGLRQSRAEMERFVYDFSTTVKRAETGIQGLKHAARTGGDDLELLIDKAQALRDELQFLVDSADQIASRLSDTAGAATRRTPPAITEKMSPQTENEITPVVAERKTAQATLATSAAERELLQVLEKLG